MSGMPDYSAVESVDADPRAHLPRFRHGRPKTPIGIGLWYVAVLVFFYVLSLLAIGRGTLLEYAGDLRPYAPFYRADPYSAAEGAPADKLVFFLGDSCLLMGGTDGERIAEIVRSRLISEYPELGGVSLTKWAFGSATLFHHYCLMFEAERHSSDLVIIPINWAWLSSTSYGWRRSFHFRGISGRAPISEQFNSDKGNPLRMEGISLADQLLYSTDVYVLYAKGAKLWMRQRIGISPSSEGEAEADLKTELFPQLARGGGSKPKGEENYFLYAVLHPDHPSLDLVRYVAKTTECLDLATLLEPEQFMDNLHFADSGHLEIAKTLSPEIHRILMMDSP